MRETNKRYITILILFGIIFFSVPSWSSDELIINLKESNEILVRSITKKDKGILVISYNPASRDFYFNFITADLQNKWKVKINKHDFGYLNTLTDSRHMNVFFTSDYIYILHEGSIRYNASGGSIRYNASKVYVVQIDYTGTVKSGMVLGNAETRFERYFLQDDKVNVLCSNPKKYLHPERFIMELNPENLSIQKKHDFTLPEEIERWNISEQKDGTFYYYGEMEYSSVNNMTEMILIETDVKGNVLIANNYQVKQAAVVSKFNTVEVCNTYFVADHKNGIYYIPGLLCGGPNAFRTEGFVIYRLSRSDKQATSIQHRYKNILEDQPMIKSLKKGFTSSSFSLLLPDNSMIITLWLTGKQRKGSLSFLMTEDGKLIGSYFSKYQSQASAKNNFSVTHNGESNYHLSKFYTQYLKESGIMKEYKSIRAVVNKQHLEEKEKYSINIDQLSGDIKVIIDFNEKNRILKFIAIEP